MAVNAYMSFTGQKQGVFKGNIKSKGSHAGKSIVFGLSYGVQAPRDIATGMASGKRRHQPITIRKEVDAASPQLLRALVNNETLNAKLEIFKAGNGSLKPNYILELTGGHINSIKDVAPAAKGSTHSEGRDTYEQEEISFTFQMIDVTWNDGGITMHDDWFAPV
jgi:type VI secretion system secreted protein Hcp